MHRTGSVHFAWVVVAALLAAPGANGQVTFEDVATDRGIGAYDAGDGFGAGIAVADYDADGDLDFFVPNGHGAADQLYRNLGGGQFENVAVAAGVASTRGSRAALWLDFDGDRDLDLIVGGDCYEGLPGCTDLPSIRFFRQRGDHAFDEVTSAMGDINDGVTSPGQLRSGFVAGDLNRDGWPDVVVGLWSGRAFVLLNDQGQGFIDASDDSGIATASFHHWQPAIFDFDGDGWADIYWAIDFAPNRFWRNDRDGTFTDIAPRIGLDNTMNDMGLILGDPDNDGDLDIYVTEITEFDKHNVLFRNDTVDGALAFEEVARDAGVDNTGFGWGTTFLDADNDGWLDLAVTNGWFNGIGYDDTSRFFHNAGGRTLAFTDRSAATGFDDAEWGVALVAFDMDRDGDLDMAQTCNQGPVRILANTPGAAAQTNRHLVIAPRMAGPNSHAIGAIVRAEAGPLRMTRLITAGTSHLGQEPAEAFFGLGAVPRANVIIAWPDGAQTILDDVDAGQVLTVERSRCPGTADLDGNSEIDFADLVLLLSGWGPCPTRCPQDVDESGAADIADLLALLTQWGVCE